MMMKFIICGVPIMFLVYQGHYVSFTYIHYLIHTTALWGIDCYLHFREEIFPVIPF